jgi:hypothetical protein
MNATSWHAGAWPTILIALALMSCGGHELTSDRPEPYRVGAYYYLWFPEHFRGNGFLRAQLKPPQEPELGRYQSTDPAVAAQHIAWASAHGLDFLALDWWPQEDNRLPDRFNTFLAAPNIGDIRFCVFYESWRLNFDRTTGATTFDEAAVARFERDMVELARTLFPHPSYLRVNGRPVVILYLTRTWEGRYAEAVRRARAAWRRAGHDPFLVADEIFWEVIPADRVPGSPPSSTAEPQRKRLALFDAVTGYNLYDFSRTQHAGYAATSRFLPDAVELYRRYAEALSQTRGRPRFVPGILPGYNDRGIRRRLGHYAIPRQTEEGASEGSFLVESFECLARPFADPGLNLVLLTSWNEWNEDTAIEPLKSALPTAQDQSPSGIEFTQGFAYSGHGTDYLEILRDQVAAVFGQAEDSDGRPVTGAEVRAWQGDHVALTARTDCSGHFVLFRPTLTAGVCRLEWDLGPGLEVRVTGKGAVGPVRLRGR